MENIKLGKKVVVSDPCYKIGTWCQAVIENVKPGIYYSIVKKIDAEDWGNRCSMLFAIHEDYFDSNLNGLWEKYPATIGVDSGQCGIFSFESYRNNEFPIEVGDGDISFFSEGYEKWYQLMCSRTLGEKSWGIYDEGIVSSSGLGDGAYDLFVVKKRNKIIAFAIDYAIEDGKYIDFDYKNFTKTLKMKNV